MSASQNSSVKRLVFSLALGKLLSINIRRIERDSQGSPANSERLGSPQRPSPHLNLHEDGARPHIPTCDGRENDVKEGLHW
jgi:hypothetical protein